MVTAIIQARMSSSRLPGKVMMDLCGEPIIKHIIGRLKCCCEIDNIVLATSIDPSDDPLENYAKRMNIACYRGSLDNVLERFYYAATETRAEHIVRICADSPLLDQDIIDSTICEYFRKRVDIVKTVNMPLGLGTEVFSFSALEEAFRKADQGYQKEHVTPYIYENAQVHSYLWEQNPSSLRLTVDTPEDFQVIEKIYAILYHGKHDFWYNDILKLLNQRPEIAKINEMIQQVKVPIKKI